MPFLINHILTIGPGDAVILPVEWRVIVRGKKPYVIPVS